MLSLRCALDLLLDKIEQETNKSISSSDLHKFESKAGDQYINLDEKEVSFHNSMK